MKELLLHIGAPKTGTSHIQRSIILNENSVSRGGYHYLDNLRWHDGAHHLISFAIREAKYGGAAFSFKKEFAKLKKEVEKTKNNKFIISTELLFFTPNEKEQDRLKQLFSLFDKVKVVVFFREPVAFLNSLFKQMIRDPSDKSAEQPLNFITRVAHNLDYKGVIEAYSHLGGEVSSFLYEDYDDVSEAFFTQVLDVPLLKVNKQKANISLDGAGLKIKYALNSQVEEFELNVQLAEAIKYFQVSLNNKTNIDMFNDKEKKAIAHVYNQFNGFSDAFPKVNMSQRGIPFLPVSSEMMDRFKNWLADYNNNLHQNIFG
ncbi:hypothetical protein AN214_01369 [Pseudoalteromonas sp. P1-9]|uniref:sulfotransferase family protein n=1 Tax=Pseudoalteromonas sp. P1-9 TaxID=1710354 RepID=UPI0006D5DA48|nr:sulfotransferase family protein [Pseudoalteromonas sp. P1-9]KPV96548.1 hypothetical protein AN214_01369 [Pseudoalteromonas sp. P1-9]